MWERRAWTRGPDRIGARQWCSPDCSAPHRRSPCSCRRSGSAANAAAGCNVGSTSGTETTYECNIPTGTIGGYEVRQWYNIAPTPPLDGHITHMETDIVDVGTGEQVPISRLMLAPHRLHQPEPARQHLPGPGLHGVRRPQGLRNTFAPQRFYAAGEERAKMSMPPGYGYPTKHGDGWAVVAMVMNHRSTVDQAMIHYEVDGRHGAHAGRQAVLVRRPRLPRRSDLQHSQRRPDGEEGEEEQEGPEGSRRQEAQEEQEEAQEAEEGDGPADHRRDRRRRLP